MTVNELIFWLLGFACGVAATGLAWVGFGVISPWIRSFLSGGRISLFQVIGMRLRGSPASLIVDAHVSLLHRGEAIRIQEVESRYLAHRGRIHSSRELVELFAASSRP